MMLRGQSQIGAGQQRSAARLPGAAQPRVAPNAALPSNKEQAAPIDIASRAAVVVASVGCALALDAPAAQAITDLVSAVVSPDTLIMASAATSAAFVSFTNSMRGNNTPTVVMPAATPAAAPPAPVPTAEPPSEDQICGLFDKWNAALATLDETKVAELYAPSAVLLPTVSNKVRTSRAAIEDYFHFFLKRKPQGVIDESYVKVLSPELATHNGIYTFTLCNGDGTTQKVSARFSFTYRKSSEGVWQILEHHSSALPEATQELPSEAEIRAMFDKWNAALATRDAVKVADLYGKGAVLLPTVSNEVRTTREGIIDYFEAFLERQPQGVVTESHVQIFSADLAAHYGIYTFTLTNPDGSTVDVSARFSYTYKKTDGQWMIAEHHSSALPESKLPHADEIRGLFDEWNAALATLDPNNVADMYGPGATLLPTVSNEVRTTREGIVDYFTAFLQKKPQGVINESHVQTFSSDLAAHYGVYTFTLHNDDGTTQDVVARFSYTYKKIGGRWLIAEHHSSGMPEKVMPTENEVSALFDKWNSALATLDSAKVADCYGPEATLLPTVSNEVRTTREGIADYFNAFLLKKPQGVINESHVKIYSSCLAAHYGIYTFTLHNDDGTTQTVGARFSFTYKKTGSEWLIAEHHSSALPERILPAESMICGLFDKWNAALATLDPIKVADCYGPGATLLPTVSNQLRTDREGIIDYFKLFLTKKPQGQIEESHVQIFSSCLAAHYGIYTFELTNPDGTTQEVGARFSFTYRKFGEDWLIAEHHSSALPESVMPTEAEITAQFDLWNAALATRDPIKVADLYAPSAILLPTVSNEVRSTREGIIDYFTLFLAKRPQGIITESHVKMLGTDLAAHYGVYSFDLHNPDGTMERVGARFSFTYRKSGNNWLILEHHSSFLPENVAAPQPDLLVTVSKYTVPY